MRSAKDCMYVLCEIALSCPTLCDLCTVACQAPRFMRILQVRILEWVSTPFSRGSSQPRERTHVSPIAGRFFKIRKPMNTGVGSLSLLQGIFPTQESNQGLLHWRWVLHQLSYEESPRISCRFLLQESSPPWNQTHVSCIAGSLYF